METMKHVKVDSSNVKSVGYDGMSRLLEVAFHDGGTYRYHDVPAVKHQELMRAPSVGKYLNSAIKPHHRCAKA